MDQIQYKKLRQDAIEPTQAYPDDAGYDLSTVDEEYTLAPGEYKRFSTGLIIAVIPGHYGRIAPRSGLAGKNGIDVLAGVVDRRYRGDVGVILINLGQKPVKIAKYQKIAQIVIVKCASGLKFQEVEQFERTEREDNGFGSTDEARSPVY